MSIFKKIGRVLKKVAPFAAMGAAFIPGIGPAISGGLRAVSGLFSAGQAGEMGPNDGPQLPGVEITGKANSPDWEKLGTAAISGGLNYMGQRQANAANARQAQQQMDFQREMSSTSYQRGTADMKAAGLNPMLGYAQGGASTPGGASASMESDLGEGANSAMSAAMTITQMKSALAGIERTNAETDVAESQAGLLNAQKLTELNRPENVRASTESLRTGRDKSEAELRGILLRNTLLNETMEDQKYEIASAARLRGHQAESTRLGLSEDRAKSNFWESAVGKASPYINLGTETANSAIGAIGKAMRLGKFGF